MAQTLRSVEALLSVIQQNLDQLSRPPARRQKKVA
jgi:hypothetical protein